VALYTLRAAYGGYDVSLMLSGQHDHNEGVPSIFGTNTIPGTIADDNSFNASLGGVSPIGTTYSLQGNANDDYGNFPETSSGAASVTGNQPLLKNFWIDDTRLAIRVGRNRLKYSELGLKLQIMTTATSVEQAYFDLIYDRENVTVQEKAVELAERLVSENRKRLEVGALAPLDLESAEAQAAQSRAAVIAAKSQLSTQENVVKQLITDQFAAWADLVLEPSGTLTATHRYLSRQDSWKKGLTQRPDYLQSKLDVEKAGIQLKYDVNQVFPELDVFGTYGFNGGGKEFSGALYDVEQRDHKFYTYGGKVIIPLGNISARNTYKSDKATEQQLVLTLKKLEETILIAIDNDIQTVQANYDQVQATTAERQYEEAALDAEQKKLENGKSTTYTVLQVQRDLTTARGAEIQALDNYNKSLSQFSFDEGSTLERLAIDVQTK
jgi:outer membrane protein TolC